MERAPGIYAAVERVHAHDPPLPQQQRRTGAGSFVWSTAEQDDVAIARDVDVARLQVFEGNAQGPRYGVHVALESAPDVHCHDLFAGFQHSSQLLRSDAVDREFSQEALALHEFPADPGSEQSHGQHHHTGTHAHRIVCHPVELAAEDVALGAAQKQDHMVKCRSCSLAVV